MRRILKGCSKRDFDVATAWDGNPLPRRGRAETAQLARCEAWQPRFPSGKSPGLIFIILNTMNKYQKRQTEECRMRGDRRE
ncbi:hypothetical protein BZU18_22305 [Salmonella enterica subsp. enterica serovar Shubra]|nr:hypothetical protein [Salmonella enterica subsp. enterica serovar Amager]EDE8386719.1 hypothetical protein [Salmonella enterica subsp. enterica serovar Shubra]EHA9186364.1 hypothetical protein [Salmonella enterica subsp. enterica serovar Shubra]